MAFMAPLLPWFSAGSAAIAGVSSIQAAQYQSAVAARNAKLQEENMQKERLAAAEDMEQRDLDAKAQIAAVMSEMDASGISSSSGSFLRRVRGLQTLATRDRTRLGAKLDAQVKNSADQVAASRAEAKATKPNALSFLSTAFNVGSSYLSGASMYNEYKYGKMRLSDPSYV